MATFKVGQRVRVRRDAAPAPNTTARDYEIANKNGPAGGKEGVIVSIPASGATAECSVLLDDYPPSPYLDGSYAAMFYQLEPLTDPKADEFIEQVKRWKPEPEVAGFKEKTRELQQRYLESRIK
jgi:hypothetical protein